MLNVFLAAAAMAAAPPPAQLARAPAAPAAVASPAADVGDADLQDMRGGFSLPNGATLPTAMNSALSSQDLSGYVGSNSVTAGSVSSGAISFDGRALQGFNGVGNFLLNTGVNSLLQGAVNVTVNLAPAAAGR